MQQVVLRRVLHCRPVEVLRGVLHRAAPGAAPPGTVCTALGEASLCTGDLTRLIVMRIVHHDKPEMSPGRVVRATARPLIKSAIGR